MKKKLGELAHSRAGDKGNTVILSLFPFAETDYPLLVEKVTVDKVKQYLSHQLKGNVVRYLIPELHALLFTCENALSGGVTTSLALDAHGKSLSNALLEIPI